MSHWKEAVLSVATGCMATLQEITLSNPSIVNTKKNTGALAVGCHCTSSGAAMLCCYAPVSLRVDTVACSMCRAQVPDEEVGAGTEP